MIPAADMWGRMAIRVVARIGAWAAGLAAAMTVAFLVGVAAHRVVARR